VMVGTRAAVPHDRYLNNKRAKVETLRVHDAS
jgi:hypothetical protein